ncbi:unnamed protein product [Allacma fusca]|uniref:Integrase catalytic domain-containing protein n=1 Tax=Allacma fusca TaxID=39272 RepID=A0A8J2L2F4_9HEXA|nr:unnamed protein product [Allacma fusca]
MIRFSSPQNPLETITIDFAGPFPESPGGNTYFLITVDHLTRYVEVYPISAQNSSEAIRGILQSIASPNMDPESSLLVDIVDETMDPTSSALTPEEEEIVRNFSLSPPGSPVGEEDRGKSTTIGSTEMTP